MSGFCVGVCVLFLFVVGVLCFVVGSCLCRCLFCVFVCVGVCVVFLFV